LWEILRLERFIPHDDDDDDDNDDEGWGRG
jgi:hypothetical protein